MSTQLHNPDQPSGPVPTQAGSKCEGKACRTGFCSPCLVVWGLVIVWLIANAFWERFQ